MPEIDKLCYTSGLRYVNAGEKCFFSLVSIILCIGSRSVPASLAVFSVCAFFSIKKGGISVIRYLKLLTVPLVFLLMSTLAILVSISSSPPDSFAVHAGFFYLTVRLEDIFPALQLVITSLACVSCLYFLTFSTPVTDILAVLEACRLPRTLIELMLLTYRFIFILLETAYAMILSQDARLGNRDFRTSIKSRGLLASTLFIRAMRQAGALYDAMESRCYSGQIRVLKENNPPRPGEIILIAAFEIFLALLIILTERIWG